MTSEAVPRPLRRPGSSVWGRQDRHTGRCRGSPASPGFALMRTWTAQITSKGRPEDVLGVLTDPAACGRWAPIDFDVDGLDGDRLVTGSRARVVGRIAGQRCSFDVDVIAADARGLKLLASGPIVLNVASERSEAHSGSQLTA